MMPYPTISNVILITTVGTLFYAAWSDFKEYKIPNWSMLLLVGLFLVHTLVSGRWTSIYFNLGLAAIIFIFCIFFYSQNIMGGGDVKILSVAFLWVGIECALPLAVLIMLFSAIHVGVIRLGWKVARPIEGRMRIPFAPSVAAALVCTFIMDCLKALPSDS